MADAYVGEIRCFGFNFAPINWAQCNGQLLSISQNTALFSLLGTTYGGNGTTNFALPNLQGQIPMHWGSAAGVPTTVIGENQGQAQVTLTTQQLPSHNHTAVAARPATDSERSATPNNMTFLSTSQSPDGVYQTAPSAWTAFAPNAISPNGGTQPHDNMQPYLTLNFCIALYGYFPPRS
ncbi:MAG: tail fiber protein [Terracidiphilus sp.]